MKPPTSIINDGENIIMPYLSNNLHHEVELGVIIGKRASCIKKNEAMDYVGGYALCLDMTARDLQEKCKEKRIPWSICKGFDTSCPVSTFISKSKIKDPKEIHLRLTVQNSMNGKLEERQNEQTNLMIFDIPTLIEYISHYFTLEIGDLILTGTPAGVGKVSPGDKIISELWTSDESIYIKMENAVVNNPASKL